MTIQTQKFSCGFTTSEFKLIEEMMFFINKQQFKRKFRNKPRLLKATGSNNRDNFTLDQNFDSTKKTKVIIHGWKNKYLISLAHVKLRNSFTSMII